MKAGLAVVDRRMAIGGALAGAAGLALPLRQPRPVTQRGMVGGGLVRFEQGEANFSFFASRMIVAEGVPEVFLGSIIWVDNQAGLTMRSTAISAYIVPQDQPEKGQSRQILGMMSVNEEDEYPFELVATNADLPGTGLDSVSLIVGDGALTGEGATPAAGYGFNYMATGPLVSGDVQEIGITIDPVTGVVGPAEEE
jgi:hypothetical protein